MSPATPAAPPTLIDKARRAVDRLRDFAREHGMSHHQRDPLVLDIHAVIDAFESPAGPATPTPEGWQPTLIETRDWLQKQADECRISAEQIEGRIRVGRPFSGDENVAAHNRKNQQFFQSKSDAISSALASGPAVSPQPQTRVQRDVVMTAIRGCCRTDRVGLTEREIDALTQAIVDAYGPAAVSPQPEPPRDWLIFDAKDRLWWKPLAKGYTPNIDEAGRFTEYQAKGYESFTNDRHDIAIPLPAASQPPAVRSNEESK